MAGTWLTFLKQIRMTREARSKALIPANPLPCFLFVVLLFDMITFLGLPAKFPQNTSTGFERW
jgi:hypothetical protein